MVLSVEQMDNIKRIDNEMCLLYGMPCIENECSYWKETRSMTRKECLDPNYKGPVTETRWCEHYKKSIPFVYET